MVVGGEQQLGAAQALGALVDQHAQAWPKAGQLALPVAHHRGWADQERRAEAGRRGLLVEQQRDRLRRVVTEDVVGDEVVIRRDFKVVDPACVDLLIDRLDATKEDFLIKQVLKLLACCAELLTV